MKASLQTKTCCVLFILLLISFAAPSRLWPENEKQHNRDIAFAIDTTGLNYFIYGGRPTGVQLDLLQYYMAYVGITPKIGVMQPNLLGEQVPQSENRTEALVFCMNEEKDSITSKMIPISLADGQVLWKTNIENLTLSQSINCWYAGFKETDEYKQLMCRYFDPSARKFTYRNKSRLSGYDDMIKRYCQNSNWDWRLISSIAYQESKFVHDSESHRGAYGLFQIQPATADFLGVDDFDVPENNTRAGIKLLNWLSKQFSTDSISDTERIKFVLAAYNAGIGRIEECRKFASAYEHNPDIWNEVSSIIPLMRNAENCTAANLKLGVFNGTETLNFVSEVLERYEHYKRLLPE